MKTGDKIEFRRLVLKVFCLLKKTPFNIFLNKNIEKEIREMRPSGDPFFVVRPCVCMHGASALRDGALSFFPVALPAPSVFERYSLVSQWTVRLCGALSALW